MVNDVSNANRKHLRWSIAGVVMLLVTSMGWWNWPRGDARFVGKWLRGKAVFEMHANQRGYYHRNVDGSGDVLPLKWWIEGDVLCVDPYVDSGVAGMRQQALDLWDRLRGRNERDSRLMKYDIVSVEQDSITFRDIPLLPSRALGRERKMTRLSD